MEDERTNNDNLPNKELELSLITSAPKLGKSRNDSDRHAVLAGELNLGRYAV